MPCAGMAWSTFLAIREGPLCLFMMSYINFKTSFTTYLLAMSKVQHMRLKAMPEHQGK